MTRHLLADIGGTNARFALLDEEGMGPLEVLTVADHERAADAVATFLGRHPGPRPIAAAIGAAGPVINGRCVFTNSDWVVDAAELGAAFGFRTVRVVNDFEATARSLPRLGSADLRRVGVGRARADAPCLVLGPGTGLGVACLVPADPLIVLATEAGHATLASTSTRQDAIIAQLRSRLAHVSAERVLSGDGLVNLHDAIAAIDGRPLPQRDAAAITDAALRGVCAVSREALDTFCAWLGAFAGDLALTFGARGGVYIAGGIVPRFVEHLAGSAFRAQFEAKGRFRDYLREVPVDVILRKDAAFVGLATLVEGAASVA